MFDDEQICPYTGLRSFTEEESLYFKGREEDIDQATSQLQKNKFLMLTGASGDGKSSLIYAGIIPNARAGFLKSKYTQWCVADFRPERTPFDNLCRSLARQLDIPDPAIVQSELNHGFSSLVDLYKNSKRFIDPDAVAWQAADDKSKAAMKREAANLIILVDQFEEFFTNPENYQHGAPSREANLVLNLLLETAHIALEENLPIYVVFTMRSDYIGQCAAFRGLPEYLGFSQFFVPRLNRTQLQQVIEEPALLAGIRITRRLTERLIHDITEGVDQLPILQHALNQIWVAADHGREEMDLVHYAMVGGMSTRELPEDDEPRFNKWFSSLTPEIKQCYHAPNLQNVLDTHTNKLFEQAAGYYTAKTQKPLSPENAKLIIRTAFTCLTKIDQSRAVRNRMTLQEITNILGKPELNAGVVGTVLNIFREPGNTFIHPFISIDHSQSEKLHPDQVLDITHESLIRNWQYLGRWAREESDSRAVSLDFEQQLSRWVNSGKSNSFLLSIGPLTYFEEWYNIAKPNAWWIARYLPEETTKDIKLGKANEILNNAREFLQRSARKHVVTRTVMRYGPKRIAAVLGMLVILTLSSFAVRNFLNKQNSAVLKSIQQQSLKLVANPKVGMENKIPLLGEQVKMGITTVDKLGAAIKDPVQKINVLTGIAALLVYQGNDEPRKEIFKTLGTIDSLLEAFVFPENDAAKWSSVINEINDFRVVLEFGYYYNPDPAIAQWRQNNALRSGRWAINILEKQPANYDDIQNLNLALENAINYKALNEEELKKLIAVLSPFENGLQSEWLQTNFNRDKILIRGAQDYGFSFNGLYQELAYLYAASGNAQKVLQCTDSLLKYSQNNLQGDYAAGIDNATNIAAVFFLNGKTDQLDDFVNGYCIRKNIPAEEFYMRLLGRFMMGNQTVGNLDLYSWMQDTENLNLQFAGVPQMSWFFNKYRDVVQTTMKEKDQQHFLTALSYKNEGILKSLYENPTGNKKFTGTKYFDSATMHYRMVNNGFLEQPIPVITTSGADLMNVPRKYLFLYPDIKTSFHPFEPRSFYFFYFSDVFMDYILNNQLLDVFYPTPAELTYINTWMGDYNSRSIELKGFLSNKIRYEVLQKLEQYLESRKVAKSLDLNWLYLYLGADAQGSGKTEEMLRYYDQLQYGNIFNILRSKEFGGLIRNQSFRMIGLAVVGYSKAGQFKKAQQLISQFKNPINRSSLYAFGARELLMQKAGGPYIQQLIDSSTAEMNRTENLTTGQPNREVLVQALVLQSPSKNTEEAYRLIKNLPVKNGALQNICRSYAFYGNLDGARSNIPPFISASDQSDFLWEILYGYSLGNARIDSSWMRFSKAYPVFLTSNLLYVDENN
jgi:energy-coupling factor transporter ATP-binding protein EcfA2